MFTDYVVPRRVCRLKPDTADMVAYMAANMVDTCYYLLTGGGAGCMYLGGWYSREANTGGLQVSSQGAPGLPSDRLMYSNLLPSWAQMRLRH
jgi:hypothetical protein